MYYLAGGSSSTSRDGARRGAKATCSPALDVALADMGEMLFANINDGYLEGLLRGYRAGILTSTDYANLCQCETIDGAAAPQRRPRDAAFL